MKEAHYAFAERYQRPIESAPESVREAFEAAWVMSRAERLACKPGFPKPAREGHPRWNVAEVHEWMRARRDERVVRRKAA